MLTAEAAFLEYVRKSVPYFNQVLEAGGRHRAECPACLEGQACSRVPTPWFRDPAKLQLLERQIPGISQMSPGQARRALFMRRYAHSGAECSHGHGGPLR